MAQSQITPISVSGRYFWKGDERFLIKGVVYQLHNTNASADPLADDRIEELRRDVILFKELGINALFVYSIDNTRDHYASMKLLADSNIYVIVGLVTPKSVTSQGGYSSDLLHDHFRSIDCMAEFPNTLGVIVANSVLESTSSTAAAPVIRSLTRDLKKYMSLAAEATGQRQLPVGYSASTCRLILKSTFDYLSAGNPDESIDFFCFKNYNWTGQSSMHISGYKNDVKDFSDSHIPVFFSEYGCNVGNNRGPRNLGNSRSPRRIFQETKAIYSPEMTRVFSGGVAFQFFEDQSHFGLVSVDAATGERTRLTDFEFLRERLAECTTPPSTDLRYTVRDTIADTLASALASASTRPGFPKVSSAWIAGPNAALLRSAIDWEEMRKRLEDERWVDVHSQLRNEIVEELVRAAMARVDEEMRRAQGSRAASSWRWRRAQATK